MTFRVGLIVALVIRLGTLAFPGEVMRIRCSFRPVGVVETTTGLRRGDLVGTFTVSEWKR